MIFTTSWDDGYAEDLQIAHLLDDHGCKGTFYVCPEPQHGEKMLTEDDMQNLSAHHEIGAHTMTHPNLTDIGANEARREIVESKEWIEGITHKECAMFCYPKGDCNEQIAQMVREAGFKGSRTVEQFAFRGDDSFLLPTSVHIYPFPLRPVLNRRCLDPFRRAKPHLKEMGIPTYKCLGWLKLAKALFTHAHETNQPWFHLWGHSAEVEKFGMEKHLRKFLQFVSSHEGIQHAPNSSLVGI